MASELSVFPIPAFNDNYIWCIHDGCHAVVVDPGDPTPVIKALAEHQLRLDGILITHHHYDHTGGIQTLKETNPHLFVIGPHSTKIQGLTQHVAEGETVTLEQFDMSLSVMEVPGHTLDHIAFYCANGAGENGWLFCGDTLFSAGCGRLFEGTPAQMWQSLQTLNALPASTQVYCTHEYTMANLAFAQAADPDNNAIKQVIEEVKQLREANLPSLPTSIALEQSINPFLRANQPDNWAHIEKQRQTQIESPLNAFAALRAWKDVF